MYIDFNLKVDRGSYCEYVNRNFQIQTSVFQKKKKNALKYEDRKKQEEQLANNVNGIIYVVKIRE